MISPDEFHFISGPLSAVQRSVDQLMEIADRYDLHASADLARSLENLRKRSAAHQLTLALFGGSRESKASLIQALLNTTLAQASIPPSTAACTYLAYGVRAECAVTLANSMTAWLPLEQLAEFVSGKVPACSLKKISVRFPNAALENGLVVIDTPEPEDDSEALLSSTACAVADADACIFAVKPGEERRESVIAFLRGMQGNLEKFFFVVAAAPDLGLIEREQSLKLVRQSLDRHCGLSKPRVALLSPAPADESDAQLRRERSEASRAELLEFARMRWQSLTAKEVSRVAAETLAQADGALNLKETAGLQRVKLRRAVKALESISGQSAELALASEAAMRAFAEPAASNGTAPAAGGSKTSGEEQLPAPDPRSSGPSNPGPLNSGPSNSGDAGNPGWQRRWEPTFTGNVAPTISSFPEHSVPAWVAPPSATPVLARALNGTRSGGDTTAPLQPEPEEREQARPAAAPVRRAVPRVVEPASPPAAPPARYESRSRETVSGRPLPVEPPAFSIEWRSGRAASTDDEDEFPDGEESSLIRRAAKFALIFAALAAAVLVIGRAALIVSPQLGQVLTRYAAMAHWKAKPVQPAVQSFPVRPSPSASRPAPQPLPSLPAQLVPSPQAQAASTPAPAKAQLPPAHPLSDAGLASALGRWIAASRSGNIQAEAACYAPVVGTYFNLRNVTRERVEREKQRVSEGTAGVQNYHITTIGISSQGNGQRAVLLQKDWDTPAGRGADFAGTEFERLLFAQVDGQWKIVGEQEIKLKKLHRTHVYR